MGQIRCSTGGAPRTRVSPTSATTIRARWNLLQRLRVRHAAFDTCHLLVDDSERNARPRFWYNPISFSWASRPMLQGHENAIPRRSWPGTCSSLRGCAAPRAFIALPSVGPGRRAGPMRLDSANGAPSTPPPPPRRWCLSGVEAQTAMDIARFDVRCRMARIVTRLAQSSCGHPRAPSGTTLRYRLFMTDVRTAAAAVASGLWEELFRALPRLPERHLALTVLLANGDGRWSGLSMAPSSSVHHFAGWIPGGLR